MNDLFIRMLLGHLVADWCLQSKPMALRKSETGWQGIAWCAFHVLVYTAVVCLFAWTADPLFAALVFLSHWPIDRYGLAGKWLRLINSRDIAAAYVSKENYHEIDLIFSCLVYAVCDNTMHLVLLWAIAQAF